MSKKDIKGISQLNLYRNFSKIDNRVFEQAGLSAKDIEWIKKRIAKNPKGFLFDFKELDKENKLSNNYFVFQEESNLAINKKDKDNHLLIEGDNYEALLALKATGTRVDVIYIDPPYNTGKEFIYSDDYSTNPKPVGNDDVHKHSKWLSFMKKRLILAKELLTDEGVIFVSIDDNEQAYLKVLMDEIFGEDNFIANLPRITRKGGKAAEMVIQEFDYLLIFGKNKQMTTFGKIDFLGENYIKIDKHHEIRGKYQAKPLDVTSLGYVKSLDYKIHFSNHDYVPGGDINLFNKRQRDEIELRAPRWRWSKEMVEFGLENDFLFFKNNRVYTKIYRNVSISKDKPYRIVKKEISKSIGASHFMNTQFSNFDSKKELESIMGIGKFDYPKPTNLVSEIISAFNNKDAIVLDFFAGSGTTGQAVMELNREDNGNRRFILVTNNERSGYDTQANPEYGIARAITRERLFRVINGKGSNNEKINWDLPKDLQKENRKYLSENSVNYLKVKTIHKVNGEFEEIENIKKLYNDEFNKENFSIVELENE